MMFAIIKITRGSSVTIPLKLTGDWTGRTFTCAIKKARKAGVVPPRADPVLHNFAPVPLADVGDGTAGLAVVLPTAMTNLWDIGGEGYSLDIDAADGSGEKITSPPLFLGVIEKNNP